MTIPHKLLIPTDQNELTFKEIKSPKGSDKSGVELVVYVYTKSPTKLGLQLPLTKEQLQKMLKNNIAKIID